MRRVLSATLAAVAVFIAAHLVAAQAPHSEKAELDFFETCVARSYDACQKTCPAEVPKEDVYDYWTHQALGEKRLRGKPYKPCQERCYHDAHWECTEANHARGGLLTFKMFGRWPIRRVLIFEEFVAAVVSAASAVLQFFLYSRFEAACRRAGGNPFGHLWRFYYAAWFFTYASAALFHMKDTDLTEKLDYYSAALTIVYTLYLSLVRIFWVRGVAQALLALPFAIFGAYHVHYMTFVSFDYGWNMTVLIGVAIAYTSLWFAWGFLLRPPHMWKAIVPLVAMSSMSVFEIFDFPPLFGYADPHAIWHMGVMLTSLLWTRFVVADTEYLGRMGKKAL